MLNTSNSDSLHGQGHYGFKWHFSIFPLAGLIKLVILNFENSFNGSIDFLPFAEATILVIIFWEFLMLYQIFFSPQVKRSVRFVKNYTSCLMNCWMGNIRKSSKFQRIITYAQKILSVLEQNSLKMEIEPYIKTRVCAKYFIWDCG